MEERGSLCWQSQPEEIIALTFYQIYVKFNEIKKATEKKRGKP